MKVNFMFSSINNGQRLVLLLGAAALVGIILLGFAIDLYSG
jgi:hypothetical protein